MSRPCIVALPADRLDEWTRLVGSLLPDEALPPQRLLRDVVLDPNFDPELAPVALDPRGRMVGWALGWHRRVPLENAPSDADRGYVTLFGVSPEVRRRGVGTALFERVESNWRARGVTRGLLAPYAPGYVTPGVDEARYPDAPPFLTALGWTPWISALAMEVPLWHLSEPTWIADRVAQDPVRIEAWNPRWTWDLLEFARAHFGGDWVRWVRDGMREILGGDDPRRLLLALDGDRILGLSHYRGERFGPIGVEESARGRGLGHRLTYATLCAQRDAGYRTAWFLWSEQRTADRLYSAFGFETRRNFQLYAKNL